MRRKKPRHARPLKYASTCSDCGAHLPVGTPARLYRVKGLSGWAAYGEGCHDREGNRSAEFMSFADYGMTEEQGTAAMMDAQAELEWSRS